MIKKGDHVKMTREGGINGEGRGPYSQGTTGTVSSFRTNRFFGRQAVVLLDGCEPDDPMGAFADWTLTDIEVIP